MMVVTLNAEDYMKKFFYRLTVERDGAIDCQPIDKLLW
jgi:hypothetical protein